MAGQVWTLLCNTPPATDGGNPTDCAWTAVSPDVYQTGGYTKEQYDELFGAIIGLVVIVLIVWLIKKAIEL
jgi:hypothetical protein